MLKGIVNGAEKDIVRIPMRTRNLFDCERTEGITTGKYINTSGAVSENQYYYISYPIYVEAGVEYTWRFDNVQAHTAPTVAFYNAGGTQIGVASHASNVTHFTFTTPSNCDFIRASVYIRNDSQKEAMLNTGSSPLPYEPYYQNGWEVRDSEDRLIWGREDVFEGTDSIPFKACGGPISTLTVEGNGSQSSTPSPSNIVDFEGTAEADDITGTATGTSPIAFPSDGRPLTACEIDGNGVQASTPSPTSIVPFDGVGESNGDITGTASGTTSVTFPSDGRALAAWEIDGNGSQTSTPTPADPVNFNGTAEAEDITGTATGTNTVTFLSDGRALPAWEIAGNGSQASTPSPSSIVPFDGTGERTGNLFDFEQLKNAPSGTMTSATVTLTVPHVLTLQLKANTYYTIASNGSGDTAMTPADLYRSVYFNTTDAESSVNRNNPVTVLTDSTGVVKIGFFSERTNASQYLNGNAQLWLNEGSTALSYEPYGYKITPTITSGTDTQTTPIYLGVTQTTRRIKKLVLDGTENWKGSDGTLSKYLQNEPIINDSAKISGITSASTHYSGANNVVAGDPIPENSCCFLIGVSKTLYLKGSSPMTLADFKAYLAQQYANGTPVTVWFVLETEQTGIINEPLYKIGDYADTVSSTNTGAPSIATQRGSNTLSFPETVQPSAISLTYLNGVNYYLPVTASRTNLTPATTNVYLNQVQTTRRIKKRELKGTEAWVLYNGNYYSSVVDSDSLEARRCICTHLPSSATSGIYVDSGGSRLKVFSASVADVAQSLDEWKTFLADEYAAGHPVTIWYIRSTDTTAILNEPLYRIGSYADAVSSTNTGAPDIATRIGENTLTVGTTVQPSAISLTYRNGIDYVVPVEMYGGNLFDEATAVYGKYIDSSGVERTSSNGETNHSDYIPISAGTQYTLSVTKPSYGGIISAISWYTSAKVFIQRDSATLPDAAGRKSNTWTAPPNAAFCIINFVRYPNYDGENDMLNAGSTALPYESYRTPVTTPIYLGQVPTTRRIKKVVFTGQETWTEVYPGEPEAQAQGIVMYATNLSELGTDRNDFRCSHFFVGNYRGYLISGQGRINGTSPEAFNVNYNDGSGGLQNFKAWLTSEYEAGHPVTLWYALATEQTAVVNEPLYKIGDYADTVSLTNTGAPTIPTFSDNNTLMVNTTIKPSAISLAYLNGYNYYLPITLGGVQEKYYLGQLQAKRKIRKFVLTGEESEIAVGVVSGVNRGRIRIRSKYGIGETRDDTVFSHYANSRTTSDGNATCEVSSGQIIAFLICDNAHATSETAFREYLASEYRAGHPVTIWYALETGQTQTINDPLYRISTYSDSLTLSDLDISTGNNVLTVDTKIPPSKTSIKLHAKKVRYGFKIDKSQENSESAVIYTHDALTMTPAVMDFTNDVFTYGSWENAWFVKDARPCALNVDGTVAYYLDPNDATKKIDGTPSDIYYELLSTEPQDWSTQWKQYYQIISGEYVLNDQNSAPTFAANTYYKLTYNSSFTGNFMMAFPKVWFYRHEDSQYNYIEISNYKLSDDWKCYAHINASGQEVDFIYLPMFKGVIVNSKLRSIPSVIPQGGTTASTEVTAASNLGSRWQIWDHSSVEMINDLLVLMTKSIDSQGRFGKGRESGYNESDTVTYGKLQTGTLIKKGKFHGYSSSYKEVKVFGIEGFWANRWDRVQGLLLVDNIWKVKMTPPYNFTGTDFTTLSNAEVPTGSGYLSRIQTSEHGSLPAAIISSSGKYFKDYFSKTAIGTRAAVHGGNCDNGDYCGFRFVSVNAPDSYSYWNIGASPVYK